MEAKERWNRIMDRCNEMPCEKVYSSIDMTWGICFKFPNGDIVELTQFDVDATDEQETWLCIRHKSGYGIAMSDERGGPEYRHIGRMGTITTLKEGFIGLEPDWF
jgi:hypothetical protein